MNDTILLNPADQVVVALRDLHRGISVIVSGSNVILVEDIEFGHKIAIRPILAGEHVLKYGLPIGSATRDILPGEHVHTHNLQSDYAV